MRVSYPARHALKGSSVVGLPAARLPLDTVPTASVPCPACGSGSACADTRRAGNSCRRRRVCVSCGFRFTTYETAATSPELGPAMLRNFIEKMRAMADQYERALADPDADTNEHPNA